MSTSRISCRQRHHPHHPPPHHRHLRRTTIQWLLLGLAIVFTAGRYYWEHQIRSNDVDDDSDMNRRLLPPKKQPNNKNWLDNSNQLLSIIDQKPPTFLMGIFTHSKDYAQRNLVRQALALHNDTRVCAFGSMTGKLPPSPAKHCQLLYTFVMGAKMNGPKQIVKSAETRRDPQFLLTKPTTSTFRVKREPQNDITFLNIQENVHRGKTPTWFHYASLVMSIYRIDYAIKSRGDTFLFVDQFLNQVVPTHFSKSMTTPKLVYAGDATWSYTNRHVYMDGAWYLLSKELAGWLATKNITSIKRIRWKEDADAGFCLMVRHQMVHMIALGDDKP